MSAERNSRQVNAARVHRHDEPLSVDLVTLPETGPGEVRVDLAYAGVNPIDGLNTRGEMEAFIGKQPLPRVAGGEASGWHDGHPVLVTGFGLGFVRDGTWASAAIVPEAALTPVPDGVSIRDVATIGIAGMTAYAAVHVLAKVSADDRVLVLGATGGVGSMAVSLARAAGAEVWGLTGLAEKADALGEIGVQHVLVGGPEAIAECEPTVVIDGLSGPFTGAAVLAAATGARIVVYGTTAGQDALIDMRAVYRKAITIYGYLGTVLTPEQRAAGLKTIFDGLADGSIQIRIADELPLAAVNEALTRLRERDVVGKLLLDLRA
jgi:NADPH2:quinone reductase